MKILLLNSTPTAKAFRLLGLGGGYNGSGWVEEVVDCLQRSEEVSVACFWPIDDMREAEEDKVHYYVIPAASRDLNKVDDRMREHLRTIYQECRPDVVHIFGTEHSWTTEALKIMDPKRTVVHITGLVGIYALHYYGGMNARELRNATLRDWLKGGIKAGRRKFEDNSRWERESLLLARQVMGRTSWDRACVTQINPGLIYYKCNEMLRKVFYEKEWSLKKCIRYRVFVSAGNYPLKGVHNAIKAISIVKKSFPEVELVVAGNDITRSRTVKDRLLRTSYGKYIRKLIRQCGLEENVHFTGPQDAGQMTEQYLKAHVYVLPSAIENSSNSLGEAMLLGMPCVASCVGGVQDLLLDRQEGYLYPFDEPYMLAYYIMCLFQDDEEAVRVGANARRRARATHDREAIYHRLIAVYQEMTEK